MYDAQPLNCCVIAYVALWQKRLEACGQNPHLELLQFFSPSLHSHIWGAIHSQLKPLNVFHQGSFVALKVNCETSFQDLEKVLNLPIMYIKY